MSRPARACSDFLEDRVTTGKLFLKPGPSGIGRPSHTTRIPSALSSRVTPSMRRWYSAIHDALPNGPTLRAAHVVVRVVGAEREHDHVRMQLCGACWMRVNQL